MGSRPPLTHLRSPRLSDAGERRQSKQLAGPGKASSVQRGHMGAWCTPALSKASGGAEVHLLRFGQRPREKGTCTHLWFSLGVCERVGIDDGQCCPARHAVPPTRRMRPHLLVSSFHPAPVTRGAPPRHRSDLAKVYECMLNRCGRVQAPTQLKAPGQLVHRVSKGSRAGPYLGQWKALRERVMWRPIPASFVCRLLPLHTTGPSDQRKLRFARAESRPPAPAPLGCGGGACSGASP